MIPQRIRLRGFLCYQDEQEVVFDGSSLWMLSGLNGSGKSSIFDAVTYALFGHHRGGGQQIVELINKESEGLAVEFDFLLDGRGYRARRTYKRDNKGGGRGTQQILWLQPGHNGSGGTWAPVENTGQKKEFDKWVAENIGLNYDTFTSSVLLLQGKAEKLLDSKPEGRREVLAGIVDLERYERLHKRADERRRDLDSDRKKWNVQLSALREVLPLDLEAARREIEDAETARAAARAEVERLQRVEYQTGQWAQLQRRLAEATERWRGAVAVLGDADAIEQAVNRLRELREVLPRLKDVHRQRGQAAQAREAMEQLMKQRQKLTDELARREHALMQARLKRGSLQETIAGDEKRQRTVEGRLRELTAQTEKLKECERQETDLKRLQAELQRYAADPGEAVRQARARHDELAALVPMAGLLMRFRERREALRQGVPEETAAQAREREVLVRGNQLKAEVEQLKPRREEAAQHLQKASDTATTARTLLQQARASLKEVTELDGAKVCRHCGQALTAGHVEEEKRRRGAEAAAAQADEKRAAAALLAARVADEKMRALLEQTEKSRNDARVEYQECKASAQQAALDVARLRSECGQLYADLSPEYRTRVSPVPAADWLATAYPASDDVARMRAEADGLPRVRQELREAEQAREQWGQLKARESAALQTIQRLQTELPADRAALRQEHANLSAEEKTLESTLAAARKNHKDAERDFDRLTKERDQTQAQQVDLDGKLKQQEVLADHARQTTTQLLRTLPEAWRAEAEKVGMIQVAGWENELQELVATRTDERGVALAQARLNLDVLQREREGLEAQQEAFPPEARQQPAAVATLLAAARQADRRGDEALGEARQKLAHLESARRQREEIEEEVRRLDGLHKVSETLAKLLGREYLQLHLVRRAEKQVVEHANAVLDRLSGGTLCLRLVGEAHEEGNLGKALDLESYNRVTGEKPINVAFLSGSQKFRVAVSLALGIGQYASKQHRPIESVIIDEGFGCLDQHGRQVMIQELQNLRGQMKCILLVSHQEEFADAFADGYHFQLDGGATKVTRVRK